jgi:nucleoside-diphosphate-sugar epimerase
VSDVGDNETSGITVAVTGGAGQLGTLVSRALCREPDVARVVCLDRRRPVVASPKLDYVECDVRDAGIRRHLHGVDALVHLAFVVTRHLPREEYDAINVGGSRNVFAAAASAGVGNIVYASSVAAYGVVPGHPVPLLENSERKYQPAFAYSACKWQVEDLLDAFEEDHPDIVVARMRPTILLGRTMDHPLGQLLRGRRIVSMGDRRPLPIVWDEDVADAFVLAVMQRARGAFNLSADEGLDAEGLARAGGLHLIRVPRGVASSAARVTRTLAKLGIGDAHDPAWAELTSEALLAPSSERAKRVLGWKPRCPTATDVVRRYVRVVPHRADARFLAALGALAVLEGDRARQVLPSGARVHLEVEGARGGDFGLCFGGHRLQVSRRAPRPPTARLALSDVDLASLLAGHMSFDEARHEGRIEIEGDVTAGAAIGRLLSAMREGDGVRGIVLDRVGRLLGR